MARSSSARSCAKDSRWNTDRSSLPSPHGRCSRSVAAAGTRAASQFLAAAANSATLGVAGGGVAGGGVAVTAALPRSRRVSAAAAASRSHRPGAGGHSSCAQKTTWLKPASA